MLKRHVLKLELFSEQTYDKSCVHNQVYELNASQKTGIQKIDHTTYTWAIVFSNNNVTMISGYQQGWKNFLTAFNIMNLTLNTQDRIFFTPLVLLSSYLESALKALGTVQRYFHFISVSCGICLSIDSQTQINFLIIHADIKDTFKLRYSKHVQNFWHAQLLWH